MYKLGSLFDGSGGFPLAGCLCGIQPAWAAEVEPYPIAVTRSRFPGMRHLGDISRVSGREIEPVDIVTFGSPCQDMSVAGKRAGIQHVGRGDEETTRSGLFLEAVRIIREMWRETDGQYPKFVLWENVPGAFTSNRGEDFRLVLEELIRIVEPEAVMPAVPPSGWAYADSYVGDGWSLAYRVFDAQYWGVPQRRRRIHLVLDFRGQRAREILFEREGVRGDFAPRRTPGQALAGDARGGAASDDRSGGRGLDAVVYDARGNGAGAVCGCLTGDHESRVSDYTHLIVQVRRVSSDRYVQDRCSGTITATQGKHPEGLVIRRAYGIGSYHSAGMLSNNPSAGYYEADTARTLDLGGGTPVSNQGGIAIVEGRRSYQQTTGPLMANSHLGSYSGQDAYQDMLVVEGESRYIVRRLTPTECARLQGFPDRWSWPDRKDDMAEEEYRFWLGVRNTHAAINGRAEKDYTKTQMLAWYNKLHTDGAEYKMLGNGIALPPACYCMQGIAEALEEDAWMS